MYANPEKIPLENGYFKKKVKKQFEVLLHYLKPGDHDTFTTIKNIKDRGLGVDH